jgi:transcriptional regulator with XRE-family HTH domain
MGREAHMNLKAFGARLKELRDATGLSQKALAEKAGLSQRNIANWELGLSEPILSGAAKLAEALGVAIEALLEEPASVPEVKRGRPRKDRATGQGEPEQPPRKPRGRGKDKK